MAKNNSEINVQKKNNNRRKHRPHKRWVSIYAIFYMNMSHLLICMRVGENVLGWVSECFSFIFYAHCNDFNMNLRATLNYISYMYVYKEILKNKGQIHWLKSSDRKEKNLIW